MINMNPPTNSTAFAYEFSGKDDTWWPKRA